MSTMIKDSDKIIAQIHSSLCAKYNSEDTAKSILEKCGQHADFLKTLDDTYRTLISTFKQNGTKFASNSNKNFRFELQARISPNNESSEKILEKMIANTYTGLWANQVPVASGIFSSRSDKKRAIDLVQRLTDSHYEFIELKTRPKTNNPVYATFEILLYGIIYVFYRNNKPIEIIGNEILKANSIDLIVAAPGGYYKGYSHLQNFQRQLSKALTQWETPTLNGLHMDFRFDAFDFDDKAPTDKSNVARFVNKTPLFQSIA